MNLMRHNGINMQVIHRVLSRLMKADVTPVEEGGKVEVGVVEGK